MWIALIHLGLSDLDSLFHWLDRAFEERDGSLILITAAVEFDPVRDDPRFKSLLEGWGLATGVVERLTRRPRCFARPHASRCSPSTSPVRRSKTPARSRTSLTQGLALVIRSRPFTAAAMLNALTSSPTPAASIRVTAARSSDDRPFTLPKQRADVVAHRSIDRHTKRAFDGNDAGTLAMQLKNYAQFAPSCITPSSRVQRVFRYRRTSTGKRDRSHTSLVT